MKDTRNFEYNFLKYITQLTTNQNSGLESELLNQIVYYDNNNPCPLLLNSSNVSLFTCNFTEMIYGMNSSLLRLTSGLLDLFFVGRNSNDLQIKKNVLGDIYLNEEIFSVTYFHRLLFFHYNKIFHTEASKINNYYSNMLFGIFIGFFMFNFIVLFLIITYAITFISNTINDFSRVYLLFKGIKLKDLN